MSKCQSYKIKILNYAVTRMEIVELAKAFAREQAPWFLLGFLATFVLLFCFIFIVIIINLKAAKAQWNLR